MATIYDVAREASVSTKTVSRVLNSETLVNVGTRQRVNDVISRLDYVPSTAARSMRSNRSDLIGLITGAISPSRRPIEPYGLPELHLVQGVQSVMTESGKSLIISDAGGQPDNMARQISAFARHRVDGMIYLAEHYQEITASFDSAGCPAIIANCFDRNNTPAVVPDDRTLQRTLVEQIIRHGHQRIGFLTLDRALSATALRLQGYSEALSAANIPFDSALHAMADKQVEGRDSEFLTTVLDRLLSVDDPPTVLCCGNDEMAMRVYGLLRSRGMRVPEDISVAGFDNYRVIAETLYPSLTTVELPYRQMGRTAAEQLLNLIDGTTPTRNCPTLVSGTVAWRSSVTTLKPAGYSLSERKQQ